MTVFSQYNYKCCETVTNMATKKLSYNKHWKQQQCHFTLNKSRLPSRQVTFKNTDIAYKSELRYLHIYIKKT